MAPVENVNDDPFAKALAAGRSRYNTRFALARMGPSSLQPDAFLEHLQTTVRPIIAGVHRVAPGRTRMVLDALYEVSLDLVGRGWMGPAARFPVLDEGWRRLGIAGAVLLAEAPRRIVVAFSNALYTLSQEPAARPEEWIDGMAVVGRRGASLEVWLDAGRVLAWRCGLAHYRERALEVCARLSPDVAAVALGVENVASEALPALLDALRQDPWMKPADVVAQAPGRRRIRLVEVCGGFRGIGGPFLTPPRVAVDEGGFIAWDREACWSLHADVFGTVFRRSGPVPATLPEAAEALLDIEADGAVRGGVLGEIFPDLSSWSSAAAVGTTLAVTLPDAHYIYLIALTV